VAGQGLSALSIMQELPTSRTPWNGQAKATMDLLIFNKVERIISLFNNMSGLLVSRRLPKWSWCFIRKARPSLALASSSWADSAGATLIVLAECGMPGGGALVTLGSTSLGPPRAACLHGPLPNHRAGEAYLVTR
jgi:hypothetical protein